MQEAYEQLDKIYPYLCVLPRIESHPALTIRQGDAVNAAALFPEFRGLVNLLITFPTLCHSSSLFGY